MHLSGEFNSRIQPVGDIANPFADVARTIAAGAVSITENVNKKESVPPSVESHSSALPAVQSDQKPRHMLEKFKLLNHHQLPGRPS